MMSEFSEEIKDAFLGCTVTFPDIENDKMRVTTFELFELAIQNLIKVAYDKGQQKGVERCIEHLNVK